MLEITSLGDARQFPDAKAEDVGHAGFSVRPYKTLRIQ